MYRFLFRPRWILFHLLCIGAIILMINLGFWQLRRLDEKRDFNAAVRANESQPAAPIGEVEGEPSALAFRRVTATGTYDVGNEVIIRARSLDERPGVWVVTPLRPPTGEAVLVLRGFLPSQGTLESVPAEARPPSGEVTVEGLLQETQTKGVFGATDPAEGRLPNFARVDVDRIEQQLGYEVDPMYVQLTSSSPAPGQVPQVLPEPTLDEGPHLSYAIQWFIFSTIAAVGYPLILRRSARNREDDAGSDGEGEGPALTRDRQLSTSTG